MRIFGLGMPEMLLIVGAILLLFGPKQLPKLAKSLGKSAKALREGLDAGLDEDDDEDAVPAKPKKAAAKAATVEPEDEE